MKNALTDLWSLSKLKKSRIIKEDKQNSKKIYEVWLMSMIKINCIFMSYWSFYNSWMLRKA